MANSLRVVLSETNMATRLNIRAIAEKINHHSGYCHQLVEDDGENCVMMLANTIQGNAMSIARIARNRRIFSGIICLLIIQNPSTPIASKAATDCKVMLKICIPNRSLVKPRVCGKLESVFNNALPEHIAIAKKNIL
jgi:hypothetical protein